MNFAEKIGNGTPPHAVGLKAAATFAKAADAACRSRRRPASQVVARGLGRRAWVVAGYPIKCSKFISATAAL